MQKADSHCNGKSRLLSIEIFIATDRQTDRQTFSCFWNCCETDFICALLLEKCVKVGYHKALILLLNSFADGNSELDLGGIAARVKTPIRA
jgi:hypothetical protein